MKTTSVLNWVKQFGKQQQGEEQEELPKKLKSDCLAFSISVLEDERDQLEIKIEEMKHNRQQLNYYITLNADKLQEVYAKLRVAYLQQSDKDQKDV